LITHSSLRKDFRKLIVNPKGFSSVIGTTFMVLVMLVLATGIFLWTLSENTEYFQAVKEKNQLEADRLNERVSAENVNYTVSGDAVSVEVDLKNEGSLSVHLTTLWVLDTTIRKYGFNNTLNINLKPGEILPIKGTEAIKVVIEDADNAHVFSSWFITARGNAVPLEKERGIIVAQLAQGIGSLALDYPSFRFFTYATSTRLANYPDGNKDIAVPGQGTPIAFGAVLTNLDPQKKAITLNRYSNIWLIFPGAPGQIIQFFIVNVASDGTITTPYSPITIAFGETKLIVFASSSSSSFSQSSISSALTPNPAAVNLLLLGTIGTQDYGQNIPFVSLYVYKP